MRGKFGQLARRRVLKNSGRMWMTQFRSLTVCREDRLWIGEVEVRSGLSVNRVPNWRSRIGRGSGQSKFLGVDFRWGSGSAVLVVVNLGVGRACRAPVG